MNKAVCKRLILSLTFYEDVPNINSFGTNTIAYEIIYRYDKGIMSILEIGAFGDRTLIKRFQDKRGRGITEDEMLENIKEISNMTYEEFKEKILKGR